MAAGDSAVDRTGAPALGRYALAWSAAALPAFFLITLLWKEFDAVRGFGVLGLGLCALAFPVIVRRVGVPRGVEFVYFLLGVGVAFSVVSIVTGWGNGLTDEPFTTPRFASFLLAGHDPYVTQMVFVYHQYGTPYPSRSFYLYLPLLMFLQFPGISYKWFAVTCWALTVVVVRRRFDTAILLAQPYLVLVAASGYNDLVVFLLLTVGFVGIEGRRQKWAEYLALGCKQFANAFVLVYYAVRRDWKNFVVTGAVSAAFLVPFLVWSGPAVICPAVFANRLTLCAGGGNDVLLLNYPAWAVWAVAVFFVPVLLWARGLLDRPSVGGRLAAAGLSRARLARLPSVVVVAASGVLVGLAVGTPVAVLGGTGPLPSLAAGAAAAAAAVGWTLAWGGPWRTDDGVGRLAASEAFVVGATLLGVAAAVATGRPRLDGMAAGLSVGSIGGWALLVRWHRVRPVPSALDATAAPVPGTAAALSRP
ncbi:MAG TPA: hypothetical protein VMG36_00810 [Thermoplasmata archaeon]|nr:hypothetical protein [Thermoplasmata archaeon]